MAGLFVSALSLAAAVNARPMADAYSSLTASSMFHTGCPTNVLSCHNTTVQENLCCFESPGGLFMAVQLWDTNPATGPADRWTIHGLWPDNCDGTWGQFCDPSREYPSIRNILIEHNRTDLLDFMNKYWLDQGGDNESFWEHEWNKHGTCMTTLEPKCMPKGSTNGTDATFFFNTAINLYKGFPTYDILARQGILPSTTQSYTYDQITAAVKREIGIIPALDCDNNTIFEIDYYHYLRGSVIDGQWERVDAYTNGSCPLKGPLWYLPKNATGPAAASLVPTSTASVTSVTSTVASTSTSATASSAPTGVPTTAEVSIVSNGQTVACLSASGSWASSSQCATFTLSAGSEGTYTMKSQEGTCGIDPFGDLGCGGIFRWVSSSEFTVTSANGQNLLAYQGSTIFSTDDWYSNSDDKVLQAGEGKSQYTLVLTAA